NDSLNSKITDLTDKLFDVKNLIYHYKLALAQVESRLVEYKEREKLETLKQEKDGVDGKLAGLLTTSKDLDNLIESQRVDKNKEGLGYSVVPPPPAQLYSSPKKDLSWTVLPKCKDDTVTDYSRPEPTVESSPDDDKKRNPSIFETVASPIIPKLFVKFVKESDSQSKSKTDETETPKKSPVKYAKQYRKTNKKPNVRGIKRNWNNLKSHQLGPDFVMKKKACFNYGDFNHLAYDCRKRVKEGQLASKDLDRLLESQRLDNNKEGLGYSVIPPPPAQIYSSLKKDISWTRLLEFKDDTITDYSRPAPTVESSSDDAQNRNPYVTKEASPSTISPKSFIKFVKANDSPTTRQFPEQF
nr:ubiquitin hydrolase [Tanacetum cinerariifolium]